MESRIWCVCVCVYIWCAVGVVCVFVWCVCMCVYIWCEVCVCLCSVCGVWYVCMCMYIWCEVCVYVVCVMCAGFHTGFFSRGRTFVCGKVDQPPRGVWGHAPPENF